MCMFVNVSRETFLDLIWRHSLMSAKLFHVKQFLKQTKDFLSPDSELPDSINMLEEYLELLIKWNKKIDLVSPAMSEVLIERHFQDSYAACLLLGNELGGSRTCLDVGSGAGLPGVVFAILKPEAKFFLCEPREKRQIFLREVVARLGLKNIELLHSRLEDLERDRKYDLVCSRALGMQEQFLALSRELLSPRGRICQLLGPSWKGEADKIIEYQLYGGGPQRKLAFWT